LLFLPEVQCWPVLPLLRRGELRRGLLLL